MMKDRITISPSPRDKEIKCYGNMEDRRLPYAGMGYEWECSGSSRAMAYGNNIAAPSLRGGTGTMEAGVVFQVAREKPVFVDVGVKGYIGKRDGVSGNVQLRMAF